MEELLKTLKTLNVKREIAKPDYTEMKNCSLKDTIKRVEIKIKTWEEIFMIHVTYNKFMARKEISPLSQ